MASSWGKEPSAACGGASVPTLATTVRHALPTRTTTVRHALSLALVEDEHCVVVFVFVCLFLN
jgi:hypothetical protein